MSVHIYTMAGSHEEMASLFLKHYTTAFPNAKITMGSANCKDNTENLFREAGAEIIKIQGYVYVRREQPLTNFKNQAWKKSESDWIIVCDIDELCHISEKDLPDIEPYDLIRFKGYNMVDIDNVKDMSLMKWGAQTLKYSKTCMFKRTIGDINYIPGAHECRPKKGLKINEFNYKLLHYNKSSFSYENFYKYQPSDAPLVFKKKIWDMFIKNAVKVLPDT